MSLDKGTIGERQRLIVASRDALFKNALLPLILDGTSLQDEDSGLFMVPHFKQIVAMADTAAEIIGWRWKNIEKNPFIRNYGLVNALWMAVQSIWSRVPKNVRSLMDSNGIGTAPIIESIITFLNLDTETVYARQDASDVKLLQFWLVQLSKLVTEYPEHGYKTFLSIRDWRIKSYEGFQKLLHLPNSIAKVQQELFIKAIKAGALWERSARLQILCLNGLSKADFDTLVHQTVGEMKSSSNVLLAAQLIGNSFALNEFKKIFAMMPLFQSILDSISKSNFFKGLQSLEICDQISDAVISFVLSSLNRCSEDDKQPECIPILKTWHDTTFYLIKVSIRPHPIIMRVLGSIWSSLVMLSDPNTSSLLVKTVSEVLFQIACTYSLIDGSLDLADPLLFQMVHIVSIMLKAAPEEVKLNFIANNIEAINLRGRDDLTKVTMALWVVGCSEDSQEEDQPRGTKAFSVLSECAWKIMRYLHSDMSTIFNSFGRQHASLESHFAMDSIIGACDCLLAAVKCPLRLEHVSNQKTMQELVKLLITLTESEDDQIVSKSLAGLSRIAAIDFCSLNSSELKTIESRLESKLKCPMASPYAARVLPLYKIVPEPPKALFEIVLGTQVKNKSPSFCLLGIDSYVEYIRGCEQANMLGVLPAYLIDKTTKTMIPDFRCTVERYLKRLSREEQCEDHPVMLKVPAVLEAMSATGVNELFTRLPARQSIGIPTEDLKSNKKRRELCSHNEEVKCDIDIEDNEDEDISVLVADMERTVQQLHRKIAKKQKSLSKSDAAKVNRCLHKLGSFVS